MKTFFEHQQLARRNTRIMVVLFLLAVAAVVLAVDTVVGIVWLWATETPATGGVYAAGAVATAGVIFLVSLYNVARLGTGGSAVARLVGARPVAPSTTDPLERRLRNVVEEMAIASGTRVPEVYVMDQERGINAFAAGWDVSGAVVAVTRGTLETLTRDELQAVVAHEFSHILNGDMRLNIRMLGVLAGIVFLGSIGEFLVRSIRGTKEKEALAVFMLGVALFIIGYIGLFFARLIKAAVSRQREFLADASSVQFTRNPDAIAGALDQIRASSAGTLIANRYAEEMSHMFFGASVKVWMGGLLSTHPPLEERIRRVHPRFEPSPYRAKRAIAAEPASGQAPVEQKGRRAGDFATAWSRTPAESAALVGMLDSDKVDYAARLLAALPPGMNHALRSADSAAAILVALLLAEPEPAMQQQLQAIASRELREGAHGATVLTRGLGLAWHLPVIDLALATLRGAGAAQKAEVLEALEAVIHADRRVSLHEFVVLALVRSQLAPRPKLAETRRLQDLRAEAGTVLALVAHAGTRADASGAREAALKAAIQAGATTLGIAADLPPAAALTLESAGAALDALRALAPMEKEVLVQGLFAAVTVDGTIRVAEAGLMRVAAAVLDCPLPPLLEFLDPAALAA